MIEKVPRVGLPPPLAGWTLQAYISFSEQEPEVEFILVDSEGDDHRLHSAKWKIRDKGDWYTGRDLSEPVRTLVDGVVTKAMSVRPGSPKAPAGFFSGGGAPPPKRSVREAVAGSLPPFLSEVRKTMAEAVLSRFMSRWHGELSEEQVVFFWRDATVRATMKE